MPIKTYLKILLILLLIVSGCSQFKTWVNVSLEPGDQTITELFSIVEEIAEKHNLIKDESESISGKKLGFYGEPYHYYTFEVKDSTDNVISVGFIHHAMMSFPEDAGCEPENEFLEAIENTFHNDIVELEYNIIEKR